MTLVTTTPDDPADDVALHALAVPHDHVQPGKELRTVGGKRIERAGFDEVFHRALVEVRKLHAGDEIKNVLILPSPYALFDHCLHRRGADIADGVASIKTLVAIAHSVASGKLVEVASAKGAL